MVFAVITFPGSNCDRDCVWALDSVLGYTVRKIFHRGGSLGSADAVVLPGGFSYGDYLRAGALARFSPMMKEITAFADDGGIVLGICNGFQILCEAGLLPGALVRNRSLKFVCRDVLLSIENRSTVFTSSYSARDIRLPIAHSDGQYIADAETLDRLEREKRVVFRYRGPIRPDAPDGNPNGSARAIAGLINEQGNILGMMPHPERACEARMGRTDGLGIFTSIAEAVANRQMLPA